MSKAEKEKQQFEWPIIGHSNIVSYLKNNLKNGNIAHAYFFVGPDHIGKTIIAQNFVASLVCENFKNGLGLIPCGQCQCCRQLANNIHPDTYWLNRGIDEKTNKLKKNISIEQIRDLQNRLSLHSFLDSYKVAVIDNAQALSQEAANSLLKTLEEPTPKTVIILLANSLAGLPQTIISRCQVLKFLPVSTKEIFDYLLSLKIDRKKAKILAELSFGCPGLAFGYYLDTDLYNEFQDKINQFVSLLKTDINERFKIVGDLLDSNDNEGIREALLIWTKVLRDVILIKYSLENWVTNLKFLSDLKEIAFHYSKDNLLNFLKEIDLAKRYLSANTNSKLTLENLVLIF